MNLKKILFSLVLGISMAHAKIDIFKAIASQDIDAVKGALNEDDNNLFTTVISRDNLETIFPIHQAAKSALNSRILETLLLRGAHINKRSETGKTPLFYAIANNRDPYIIDFLLKRGARTDVVDDYGNTLLHAALFANNDSSNKRKNIEKLLMLGVDPMISNKNGINPFTESTLIQELVAAMDAKAEKELRDAESMPEDIENEECMVCLETIKDLPQSSVNKTKCCKHFICDSCLQGMKEKNLTTCPNCRGDDFKVQKISIK